VARARSGQDLVNDAYVKVDLQAFTDRFPRAEVLRHVNQGGAELWDIILEAQGRAFGRSITPWTITTVANTSLYTSGYPSDFMDLLTVRLAGPDGEMIAPLLPAEEAIHRETDTGVETPEYYQLVPGGIILLPVHDAGHSIIVDYIRCWTDLADSSGSTFDGVNGWEEYIVCHAAREMMLKEGEDGMARELANDKATLAARIARRAAKRDMYRPRRVRDVRGEPSANQFRFWRSR
jgi:hypothetical protein